MGAGANGSEPLGSLLPVLRGGLLTVRLPGGRGAELRLDGAVFARIAPTGALRERCRFVPAPAFTPGAVLRAVDPATGADLDGSPVALQPPDRRGRIARVAGRFVFGTVEGQGEATTDEATVLAFIDGTVVAHAVARRAGATPELSFVLLLPLAVTEGRPAFVNLALAGGSGPFDGGPVRVGTPTAASAPRRRRAARALRMAIKIAAPDLREAPQWGDTHFAKGLKAALERLGWIVRIDTVDAWYGGEAVDVDLVLRGLERYRVDPERLNLMWLISHPNRVAADEPAQFDHVFVASDVYLPTLRRTGVPCSALHQATDPAVFAPGAAAGIDTPLLFVGNSRREYRTMVRWCIERRLPLAIWGGMWEGIVPPELIRGTHIPNERLAAAYAGAGVLLNDHWDAMRDHGFLSNRLFDGSAAGAPILTDPVAGLSAVFGDTIPTVASAEELAAEAQAMLSDPQAARARAARARDIVLSAHTFDHRARTIVETVEALGGPRVGRVA
ncbi:glycosyltransferase [Methylorubrum sp. SB2]|uniref:glycosyltransferase family protein n=1 Tax=Methylorubrum subtropicum TaxID=3138812 RepID=UPI00313EF82F